MTAILNVQQVKKIVQQSNQENWPYAKTFESLKNAGVIRYKTLVSNYQTTYVGIDGQYVEMPSKDLTPLQIAESFDGRSVQQAIEHHQVNQTPYTQFMGELARAGVVYYEVYMDTAKIHYTTGNPIESYVQPLPGGVNVNTNEIPTPAL